MADKIESTGNIFIAVWDMYGLESLIDATASDMEATMHVLKTGNLNSRHNAWQRELNMMLFRARLNSHRHYEIWAFTAVDGITRDDIIDMFVNSPQSAADTIRRIGENLFDSRATQDNKIAIR